MNTAASDLPGYENAEYRSVISDFIAEARWFSGKGRSFEFTGVRRLILAGGELDANDPIVVIDLCHLTYDDGTHDLFQVPLSFYGEAQAGFEHARLGRCGAVEVYDALHDHRATGSWLRAYCESAEIDGITFSRVGATDIDPEARGTLLTGEQSNSSVVFGEDALMKVFRRLTPGLNPDVEILTGLTQVGLDSIADLYGYSMLAEVDGEPVYLGILQQFLRTASDGWQTALASLRPLLITAHETSYDSPGEAPRDAGGDFAAEAHRLGRAVAQLHAALIQAFGASEADHDTAAVMEDSMHSRLRDAVEVVPELEAHAEALRALFGGVGAGGFALQRVHGDLHLGQTLRTSTGWKIIDFEGEPAKSVAQRRAPDSPWRDVAGMIRSFDYAGEVARRDLNDPDNPAAKAAARDWTHRNINAFLAGYLADRRGGEPAQSLGETAWGLLHAYVADKCIYEAVYEARHRPSWVSIPLSALDRLAAPTARLDPEV